MQDLIIFKGENGTFDIDHDQLKTKDLTELSLEEENKVLSFHNANFAFKISRTTPIEMVRGDALPQFNNLVRQLKTLEKNNLL